MKNIILLFIVLLFACTNSDEIDKLKKENERLRQQISDTKIPKYEFQAFVVPSDRNIIKGDTLFAAIGLSAFDKENPFTAVLGETDYDKMTIVPKDTIPVINDNGYAALKIPATKIGNFSHNGAIYHIVDGKRQEFMFNLSYTVVPK